MLAVTDKPGFCQEWRPHKQEGRTKPRVSSDELKIIVTFSNMRLCPRDGSHVFDYRLAWLVRRPPQNPLPLRNWRSVGPVLPPPILTRSEVSPRWEGERSANVQ